MALMGETMLAGRGLTCMKRWALGEEFSTIRFTMLMSVSLSLICSRGRNGQFTQPWLWLPPQTPLWLSAGNRGGAAALGCLRPPDLGLHTFQPVNCFWTSTGVLMQMSRQGAGRPLDPHRQHGRDPARPRDSVLGCPATLAKLSPSFSFLILLWMKTTRWESQSPQTDTKLN